MLYWMGMRDGAGERGEGRVESIACFTGHRPSRRMRFDPGSPQGAALRNRVHQAVRLLCLERGVRVFLCGMAAGFDLFAARCMLELRCAGQIPQETCLVAVLPYPDHGADVPNGWQHVYDEVLQHCQDQCIVSPRKSAAAFRRRNDYMTARADYVLAYWNHDPRTAPARPCAWRTSANAWFSISTIYSPAADFSRFFLRSPFRADASRVQ